MPETITVKRPKKDNEGRTDRVRLALTNPRAAIMLEWAESFMNAHPERWSDAHQKLYQEIKNHQTQIDKPLVATIKRPGGMF